MASFSIEMPAIARAATEQMADAVAHGHDDKKLQSTLVCGGAGTAGGALFLAFFRAPGGVFLNNKVLFYAYYVILLAVAVFGAAEVAAGFWVSGDPVHNRRRNGKKILYASVVPLVLVIGLGGLAVLK